VDITKNVTLRGAGIGQTMISVTANNGIESPASYTGAFRITGFTFVATGNYGNYDGAMIRVINGLGFRLDHNEFQVYSSDSLPGSGNGGNAIHIKNDAWGLIDNNRFVKGGGGGCMHAMIQVSNSGTTNTSNDAQEYSWLNFDAMTELGRSLHTIFVEDNYFNNRDVCTAHNPHTVYLRHGGIAVFRHNEIHGFNVDTHPFNDQHGGYALEVSNNRWVDDSPLNLYTLIDFAAGTGVIYGNTATGVSTYGVQFYFQRASGSGNGSVTSSVPGFGNVSANSSCGSTEGYPCAQQPGRGRNNSSDPIYIWGNTLPALRNSASSYVQPGRDYFLNQGAKPGYVAYPYPHPLQNGGGGGGSGAGTPSAPSNLRIVS
jgi:hypothetical protein